MNYKILIADDEKDIVEMLSAFFTGKGYAVLTAYDGEETLRKIESRPDMILIGVNMPGMVVLKSAGGYENMFSARFFF